MVGRKYESYDGATGLGAGLKFRLVKAYAEGRQVGKAGGAATDNPYDNVGNDAEKAWDYGFDNQADAAYKFEACR
jgi:hypothetical protein